MSEKKRKPPALSLGATIPTPTDTTDGGKDMDTYSKEINAMGMPACDLDYNQGDFRITEEQRGNLRLFLEERRLILSDGEMKEPQFERLKELGFGNGGVVWKVEHKPTSIIMARKMILLDMKPAIRNQIMRELKVLQECNSPYIVGFYGNFCLNNEISICMQHMDGGSLDLIMKAGRIPAEMIANIAEAVLRGLDYLHEVHRIMHRDVKPSNVLVNARGEIKLCDFGVSGQLINSMAMSFVGTRSYMAPERLEGSEYSVHSDIWSLGVSLVEMSMGRYPIPQPSSDEITSEMKQPSAGTLPPRQGGNPYASHANVVRMPIFELLQIITTSEPPTLPAEFFNQELRSFVDQCLRKEMRQRSGIRLLLKDKFVASSNLLSCSEFADWVQRSVQAINILEKQELHN